MSLPNEPRLSSQEDDGRPAQLEPPHGKKKLAITRSQTRALWIVAVFAIVALGELIRWRGISAGWFLDDYNQYATFRGIVLPKAPAWDLYAYHGGATTRDLVEKGWFPWWTHPDFRFAPLRPLTSLLLAQSYRWFDFDSVRAHVVSHVAWIAMASACAAFYFTLVRRRVALLALLIFVAARSNSLIEMWVSGRGLLLAETSTLIALVGYIRWRRRGELAGAVVSIVAFAVALMCGEYALAFASYFLAFELLGATDSWQRRVVSLLPILAMSGAYLGWHVLGGFGTRHSWWYPNVFFTPGRFFLVLLNSAPTHLTEALLAAPLSLANSGNAGWGLFTLGFAAWWIGESRERSRDLRWLLAGAALSCMPIGGTWFQPRLVMVPKAGTAVVIASLVWDTIEYRGSRHLSYWIRAFASVALLVAHIPLSIFRSYQEVDWRIREREQTTRTALAAPINETKTDQVFLLNSLFIPVVQTLPFIRHFAGRRLIPWRVLSPANGPQIMRRITEKTIELRVTSGGIFSNSEALAFRSDDVGPGLTTYYQTDEFDVRILEFGVLGPTLLRYSFREPLESPRYRFMITGERGYALIHLPEVGEERILPPAQPNVH